MVKFGNLISIFRKQPLHFLPLPFNSLMYYVKFSFKFIVISFHRNIAELVRNVEHKISVLFIHQDFLANSSDRACERLTRLQTGKGFIFIMTAQLWCFKDRCNYDYEQKSPGPWDEHYWKNQFIYENLINSSQQLYSNSLSLD